MGEFELIRQYFMPLAGLRGSHSVVVGPGDDCAVQKVPSGSDLVFSIDTLVEGVHFPLNYRPDYLAWRTLAVAASDLAAMGADPACFTLALTLPEVNEPWLRDFTLGLGQAAESFGLALAGGDTTRGPLTLSVQVHGFVEQGSAICRSGARPGDLIVVSGALGDAGAALGYLESQSPTADEQFVLERYHHPEPRLTLGVALRHLATAAIDISDGLLADLNHILEASTVGASIKRARVPVSPALTRLKGNAAIDYALHSGDDYELCATIPKSSWANAPTLLKQQLTVIGVIESSPGLRLDGADVKSGSGAVGFDHFRRKA
ncbi:thiamine-phosphate kinase [Marinobacter sp. LV10R510-11A]|uniref:thiamine-phosphate kinase n=1 Tax=Marinobacter sp. LV10R510-11A TaxID=1415568 RepID=UPI000BB99311|nr:thiamine-phosphate kinase [Marinobacter sp. LV10R510-11A]SOB76636.1 thiamine-phosphate kinase [Marinobacter sp. LV10R510-11A]